MLVLRPLAVVVVLAGVCLAAATATAEASVSRQDVKAIRRTVRSLPFFTETSVPKRSPAGVVITLHKGSWAATGRAAAESEHQDVAAWLRRRWLVVNSSYRPGVRGLADVRATYARVSKAVGRRAPICLVGASAGGNLALIAATRIQTLSCVVAEAVPTDLVNIASQLAYDPASETGASTTGPTYVHDSAEQALGAENLRAFSPLLQAERTRARVLLAVAERDPLIPVEQETDYCARLARCEGALQLEAGTLQFVHAGVSRAALSAFRSKETAMARLLARPYP